MKKMSLIKNAEMFKAIKSWEKPELNLSRRGLKDEDLPMLVKIINENKRIKCINFQDNQLRVPVALLELENVEEINLSYNNIDDKGVIKLLGSPCLTFINLRCNNISIAGIEEIEKCQDKSFVYDKNPGMIAKIK